ncbi:hypothetical protein BJ508DRAFT_326800 [Ascobolus immersus RN42]|uniref:Uncharacterized protein n=1 Tax=Ascobolus immersus RN42 TaxID=1160509 RepID=A0A3N4I4B3_ASCIM|nr:hypothetical protein BJ508DRAFT_326800 [Ascobolus immersus RN42]
MDEQHPHHGEGYDNFEPDQHQYDDDYQPPPDYSITKNSSDFLLSLFKTTTDAIEKTPQQSEAILEMAQRFANVGCNHHYRMNGLATKGIFNPPPDLPPTTTSTTLPQPSPRIPPARRLEALAPPRQTSHRPLEPVEGGRRLEDLIEQPVHRPKRHHTPHTPYPPRRFRPRGQGKKKKKD